MSDSNYTHMVLLLDGSGSMLKLRTDIIKNVNAFIASQRTDAMQTEGRIITSDKNASANEIRCTVDVIVFHGKVPSGSTALEKMYGARNVNGEPTSTYHYLRAKKATDINQGPVTIGETDYMPQGGSPLFDAFNRTISEVESFLCGLPKDRRPGRIMFLVLTDGEDTESKGITKAALCNRIEIKTKNNNWQFIFIGAHSDAFIEAKMYGFGGAKTLNYTPTSAGISAAFGSAASTVMMKRMIQDTTLMSHCRFESHANPKTALELGAEAAVKAGQQSASKTVNKLFENSADEQKTLEIELFNQATRADAHTSSSKSNDSHRSYDYSSTTVPRHGGSCSTYSYPSKPKRKADTAFFTEEVTIAPDPEETEHAQACNGS